MADVGELWDYSANDNSFFAPADICIDLIWTKYSCDLMRVEHLKEMNKLLASELDLELKKRHISYESDEERVNKKQKNF